ncbi:45462_t:CDS:2, partial [Gigaspora margarita]
SVTIEDESSSTNSDVELSRKNDAELAQKIGQTNFEANFGRMSVEILRFLCHEMGVSDTGSKQELVSRLVNVSKKKNVSLNSDGSEKGKAVDIDSDVKEVPGEGYKFSPETGRAFANMFGNVLVDSNNLGTKGYTDRLPPRTPFLPSDMPMSEEMQEGLWKKRELSKARNQWEYNEWCRTGLLLDKALLTGDIEYVQLARQVALERAYVVMVADEDGWNVAVKMASGDWLDPMSQLFSGKRERARVAAQQFPRNKRSKISDRQNQFSNSQHVLPQFQFPGISQKQQSFRNSSRAPYSDAGASNRATPAKQEKDIMRMSVGQESIWSRPFMVEALDQKEVDHTWIEVSPKVENGIILDNSQIVTGRLHTDLAVQYWKKVINPAPVVLEWLEKRIPLFPRGVMELASLPVPKQWQFTQRVEVIGVDLEGCGWVRAVEKGSWDPVQKPKFCGLIIDTLEGLVIALENKTKATVALLKTLLETPLVSVRKLASVAGKIQKSGVLSFDRCQESIGKRVGQGDCIVKSSSRGCAVANRKLGKLEWPPGMETIQSEIGVCRCGIYQDLVASGSWIEKLSANVIAQLEAIAVLWVLQSLGEQLKGSVITLMIDNKVALRTVQYGGPRKWQKDIAREIWNLCLEKDLEIFQVLWVPSKSNLADVFTRILDPGDWTLKLEIVEQLQSRWGRFDVDRVLIKNSVSEAYNKRLEKAWKVFLGFATKTNSSPLAASGFTVLAFVAWMEMLGRVSELAGCLASISRAHKIQGWCDPTKE